MGAEGPYLGRFTTAELHGVRDRGWVAIDLEQADRRLRWTLTDAGRAAVNYTEIPDSSTPSTSPARP